MGGGGGGCGMSHPVTCNKLHLYYSLPCFEGLPVMYFPWASGGEKKDLEKWWIVIGLSISRETRHGKMHWSLAFCPVLGIAVGNLFFNQMIIGAVRYKPGSLFLKVFPFDHIWNVVSAKYSLIYSIFYHKSKVPYVSHSKLQESFQAS